MASRRRKPIPRVDRGPLRVMFLITSMPVGGAETLLVNLIRRLDRERFLPSLCCLKSLGPLGEILQHEIPAFSELTTGKRDLRVLPRLVRLLRRERIDAVITVGAGDKMFWGRIAARIAGVPVVGCAIHSTGWPDAIGRLNRSRLLVRWTDAFIGVASAHGKHLVEVERFPREKVHIIPNGVDTQRFRPSKAGESLRRELGIAANAPVVGIVAALRPEKDHALFLQTAATVRGQLPGTQFIIVGDGDLRDELEQHATKLGIREAVHFLGNRSDIPEVLNALDLFVLTSKMEANPVSILEAMASGKPVVAPRVGSIAESVAEGETGYLTTAGDSNAAAARWIELLSDPDRSRQFGAAGRKVVVDHWSLERMVEGYEQLIEEVYDSKSLDGSQRKPQRRPDLQEPLSRAPSAP